ncbi:saccharopine dehydrogenase family protein [Sandaracinus amylolyticus]|uniref:saccharopine dehydrogenase family protein n=1 Tax=Sandaracinus amylolyticus TaxID=927083 RepID=UPI001F39AE03|nr:saccharopine dehydrogenase NADP-binding domain-containing protein [Sandaracinus amylolyticus]UJR86271.1 Hypothetical protein I5071_83530 [Sandaracinus amylolyticus]
MADTSRALDVVVFGATGFTGRLVCEHLAQHAPDGTRWAIAGRDERRLFALRSELETRRCPPREAVLANVDDPRSLRAMADKARVVLTTVGPYARYGEPVVEAAVEAGSDYVDITGEPAFVDRCVERFDAKARERGARIVNSCGFESIPDDLGALFTAKMLPQGAPMTIEAFVRMRATFSGGTWNTAITGMANARENTVGRKRPRPRDAARRVRPMPRRVRWVPQLEAWAVPMPTIENEVVLRSARALDVFGPDFQFGHHLRMRNLRGVLGLAIGVGGVAALAQLGPTRELLEQVRKPGEGPDAAARARSWFELTLIGEAASHRVITTVSGGDPGYDETAKMVAESALCLALDRASLPHRAGVITPAVAMGDRLRERLQRVGIRFQVKEKI